MTKTWRNANYFHEEINSRTHRMVGVHYACKTRTSKKKKKMDGEGRNWMWKHLNDKSSGTLQQVRRTYSRMKLKLRGPRVHREPSLDYCSDRLMVERNKQKDKTVPQCIFYCIYANKQKSTKTLRRILLHLLICVSQLYFYLLLCFLGGIYVIKYTY